MNPERIAKVLAGTTLFAGLDTASLEVLAGLAVVRQYKRGQFIFQQGDPGDAMFAMLSGSVKVLVNSPDGGQVLFCTLEPEDCFGELSFLDGRARSAAIETVGPVQVIVLTRAAVDAVLDTHPAIARALLVYLCDMVRRLSEQTADLVFLDLEGRLAKCLDRLAEERGIVEPEGIRLDLALTQSDLAGMVGGSRPSVNQALASFSRRGYLRTESRSIVITDRAGLRRRHQH
ncbi:MAG TPA: Crp/Fnr family transcriptional regulator [Sporichthyaceae bacterium]|nr:Crp/Fnr family transcriptional regulator [Sporichthyaceae bacterium]